MPTADATLLPPPFSSSSLDDEPHSGRRLDAVGVETVLGAMIQHRRASQPSFASVVVPSAKTTPPSEREPRDDHSRERLPGRAPARSEVFLKAR